MLATPRIGVVSQKLIISQIEYLFIYGLFYNTMRESVSGFTQSRGTEKHGHEVPRGPKLRMTILAKTGSNLPYPTVSVSKKI
jgi:hypothetical protein